MCTFSQPKETVLSDLSACPELASCLSSTITSSFRQDWNCCHFITRTSSLGLLQGTTDHKSICGALWDTPLAYNLNQSITASRSCLGLSHIQENKQPFLKTKIFFFPPPNVILQLTVYLSTQSTRESTLKGTIFTGFYSYLIKPHSSK